MKVSPFLLLCIFLACSVWMIQGRNLQVNIDDEELAEPNAKQQGIPGICWGCKWALDRVKKVLGNNSTAQAITQQLKAVCDKIGLLKSKCKKFVDKNFGVLVEELTTTDDVRTICVNVGACKPKEQLDMIFHPNKEESQRITIIEVP
ncbi:antimicrobial peptide NK-lysin-like isoform 1-T1 [Fundulus diaphanus]